jgi:hypothetical protein
MMTPMIRSVRARCLSAETGLGVLSFIIMWRSSLVIRYFGDYVFDKKQNRGLFLVGSAGGLIEETARLDF